MPPRRTQQQVPGQPVKSRDDEEALHHVAAGAVRLQRKMHATQHCGAGPETGGIVPKPAGQVAGHPEHAGGGKQGRQQKSDPHAE